MKEIMQRYDAVYGKDYFEPTTVACPLCGGGVIVPAKGRFGPVLRWTPTSSRGASVAERRRFPIAAATSPVPIAIRTSSSTQLERFGDYALRVVGD